MLFARFAQSPEQNIGVRKAASGVFVGALLLVLGAFAWVYSSQMIYVQKEYYSPSYEEYSKLINPSCTCANDLIPFSAMTSAQYNPVPCSTLDHRPSTLFPEVDSANKVSVLAVSCIANCTATNNWGQSHKPKVAVNSVAPSLALSPELAGPLRKKQTLSSKHTTLAGGPSLPSVPALSPNAPSGVDRFAISVGLGKRTLASFVVSSTELPAPVVPRLNASCVYFSALATETNANFLAKLYTTPTVSPKYNLNDYLQQQFAEAKAQYQSSVRLALAQFQFSAWEEIQTLSPDSIALLVSLASSTSSTDANVALENWGVTSILSPICSTDCKTPQASPILLCAAQCQSSLGPTYQYWGNSSSRTVPLSTSYILDCNQSCLQQNGTTGPGKWQWLSFAEPSGKRVMGLPTSGVGSSTACDTLRRGLNAHFAQASSYASTEPLGLALCIGTAIRNSTLGQLLQQRNFSNILEAWQAAFDPNWRVEVDHVKYYAACNPTKCVAIEHRKRTWFEVIIVSLGLLGGVRSILRTVLVAVIRLLDPPAKVLPDPQDGGAFEMLTTREPDNVLAESSEVMSATLPAHSGSPSDLHSVEVEIKD